MEQRMSTNSMDRVFDSSALSAKGQVTDWFTIKEKLGNRIGGTFIGYWNEPAKGKFRAQIGVALADFDDAKKVWGVNLPEYFGKEISEYRRGDQCGFEYYKDIPSKEAGMSDTKAIRAFNPDNAARLVAGETATVTAPEEATQSQADIDYENAGTSSDSNDESSQAPASGPVANGETAPAGEPPF